MGDIFTATGAKIYIGPAVTPATDTTAEFDALTWTEIGMVESIGEYGDQSAAVTAAVLGDGRMRKGKGARDAGDCAIVVFPDGADTGQAALLAAEATPFRYGIKVELPNKLNPTGANQIDYFRALVMSKRMNIGQNDNVVRQTFNLSIDSPIYTKAATAGV